MNKIGPLSFPHGLGDCAWFARCLQLYKKHGYEFTVTSDASKEAVFASLGIQFVAGSSKRRVPWTEPSRVQGSTSTSWWRGNKIVSNTSRPPLPHIGAPENWLKELCVANDASECMIRQDHIQHIETLLDGLRRPIILVHAHGNTSREEKSISVPVVSNLCELILEGLQGSIVVLDWDSRTPTIKHPFLRHSQADLGGLDTWQLLAAIRHADALVGVDSGPLHLTRHAMTPSLGVWPKAHHPSQYSLPSSNHAHVVFGAGNATLSTSTRAKFNIVHDGRGENADTIYQSLQRLLDDNDRFVDARGTNVFLQHLLARQDGGCARKNYLNRPVRVNRHESFELVLRSIKKRFALPRIVETGTIRAEDDFAGAGYSTYVLGVFLSAHGGKLISVDHSEPNCAFAKKVTEEFGTVVEVICRDSVEYLAQTQNEIDVLVLDSMDTDVPEFASHALQEIQAAWHRLHERSLVVFDDTSQEDGHIKGKGELAVPWLLERGWRITFSGYQLVLER